MSQRRTGLVLILVCAAGLLTGCGGQLTTSSRQAPTAQGGHAGELAVIRGWASALQRGDVRGAARYFALPSLFANGLTARGVLAAVVVHTEGQAEAVNESLSCGARLVATRQQGRVIRAEFRLTNRSGPGADCGSGTGESAATDFVIQHGHIVDWIRAPADNAVPKLPAPPANSQGPAQQI